MNPKITKVNTTVILYVLYDFELDIVEQRTGTICWIYPNLKKKKQ